MSTKAKIFVFSDESGSWHDENEIYVRSWVAIFEKDYNKLINKIGEISGLIGSSELTWKSFASHKRYFKEFDGVSLRIFITVSSARDIRWNTKYTLTKDFDSNVNNFNFGELDSGLKKYISQRILREIKNALFLNFYEKHHIENAKKGIERVILRTDYELIYRVDPPQLPRSAWEKVLNDLSKRSVNIEFPKSERSHGIQFADVVAGCFRSLLIKDSNFEKACDFFKELKKSLIRGNATNPNPNLIFFQEISDELKNNCKAIWKL